MIIYTPEGIYNQDGLIATVKGLPYINLSLIQQCDINRCYCNNRS